MASAEIFIYGEIINFQSTGIEDWGCVSLKSVADQLSKFTDYDEINVHIHSCGGDVDEGFAIHDYLSTQGKKVNTIVDGSCYSIATVVFLAGTTRKMNKNAQFMIHNPWGVAVGTADEIQKYSDSVRKAEARILDFYVDKTGGDKEQIKSMMDAETFLTASEAVEMKFATEIVEAVQASARIVFADKQSKQIKMNLKEKAKSVIASFNSFIKDLSEEPIKASSVKTDTGVELEVEMAGETIAVGDTVTNADGTPFTGTATLEDGTTITCDDAGKVTEVTAPAAASSNETVAALTQEVESLKAQLEESNNSIVELTAKLEESITAISNLKKITSANVIVPAPAPALNRTDTPEKTRTVEESKNAIKERLKKK